MAPLFLCQEGADRKAYPLADEGSRAQKTPLSEVFLKKRQFFIFFVDRKRC